MKVEYLKLENVAGIMVGSDKESIEIDFTKSKNKIVSIQGDNGRGKTVLISSISPFASVTSLDERSSLSYIVPGQNGFKEIRYRSGEDLYVIKHYFKATKESHIVKSYFSLNGEELNDNGNVTSFLSLVEIHFGLTQEMMRLIRLGTNVSSFISLTPAKRKEYIGKLIEEIELYLKIYKKINEDIRVVKILLSSNSTNLYNCHISDLVVEEGKLKKLNKHVKELESERDTIVSKISKIESLEKENKIEDLRRKKQEAEASLIDFQKTEESIKSLYLENASIDKLIKNRNELTSIKINVQSKINSYRISIDNTLKSIERLEISINKIASDNDVQSLITAIEDLKTIINSSNKIVTGFKPMSTSDEVYHLITKLSSFNQISQMIHTFGNRPTEVYLRLKRKNESVDKFLKEQMKRNLSRISENDLRRLFDQMFKDDMIVTPNCDQEYIECPYYRFSEMITEFKDNLDTELFDDETLKYIQVISNNVDNILNELDLMRHIKVPDKLRGILKEKSMLDRLENKLPFFDLMELHEYLSLIKAHEIHIQNIEKLKQYEYQLSIYKNSGIDSQMKEIQQLKENVDFYHKNIETLSSEITTLNHKLENADNNIGLVSKYQDGKKYQKIIMSTLESTNKILIPLESSSNEKIELTYKLNSLNETIHSTREDSKQLDNKIQDYIRLLKEAEFLKKKHNDLNILLDSVSTKKGIPVLYMKTYLGKIQKLANSLLEIIYEDELQLAKFKVTQETFEVPYIKNGTKVPDVKYASQSEIALITMALSFALANRASGMYNILLLDEIDAGLDETNRQSFLRMLDRQMTELKAEQVFIISHNLSGMVGLPMDVIRLSDIGIKNKSQNIIYE